MNKFNQFLSDYRKEGETPSGVLPFDIIVAGFNWAGTLPERLIAEHKRSRELDAQMEAALIDPTLLDRMSRKPKKLIVRGEQEAEEIPVRILHRPLSLDGILKPAC